MKIIILALLAVLFLNVSCSEEEESSGERIIFISTVFDPLSMFEGVDTAHFYNTIPDSLYSIGCFDSLSLFFDKNTIVYKYVAIEKTINIDFQSFLFPQKTLSKELHSENDSIAQSLILCKWNENVDNDTSLFFVYSSAFRAALLINDSLVHLPYRAICTPYWGNQVKINLKKGDNKFNLLLFNNNSSIKSFRCKLMSHDEALEAMRHAVSVESLTYRYKKGRNNIWINPWVLKGIIPSFEYIIIKNGDTVCCKETEAINNHISHKYLADLSASYSCILKYDKYEERFPFIVGPPDSVYNSILRLKIIPCLEPYFFRLEKLLEITHRNYHWYYKVAFLVDKITNYKNVDKGISLHTFTSVIDSSKQNYITVSPEDYCCKKKYPLIILMNPAFSYKTHLLTSVYLHKVFAIKYLKSLCDDNGYVVLISSNRSFYSEGLSPIGVTDVLEAYNDAKLKYNIDKSRVFVFGSCLGGTKALQFEKVMYPKCAGLAMYNPAVYHRNELKDFESLQNLPIYIHHDNFDTHTPIITSERLVSVAKEKGLSLTYQFDDYFRNTYYNYFIDQDVFSFFNSVSSNSCFDSINIRDYSSGDEVMNVFAKRFCIVYGTRKKLLSLDSIAGNLQDQWVDYYDSPCAIFSDTTFLREQIDYDGVILLGDSSSNVLTEKVLYRRKMRQERRHFEKFLREDESDRCYEYSFYSNDVQYLLVGSRSMSGFDYTFKHHPWFKSLYQD